MALQFNQDQSHSIRKNPDLLVEAVSAETGQSPEALKIQFGRRIIYGQLASGEERKDLDADRASALMDAMQQPAAPGVSPSDYTRKLPAIQIPAGDEVLFRQERDGTISQNQINLQIEQAQPQASPPEAAAEVDTASAPNPETPKALAIAPATEQSGQVEQKVAQFLHEAEMAETVMQDRYFKTIENPPHIPLVVNVNDWAEPGRQSIYLYDFKFGDIQPSEPRSNNAIILNINDNGLLTSVSLEEMQKDLSAANLFAQNILELGYAEAAREQRQQYQVEQAGEGDLTNDLNAGVTASPIGVPASNPILSSNLTETTSAPEVPISPDKQRQDMIAISSELANPLAESTSGIDIEVSAIGGFDIWRSEHALAVTQGGELVAFAAIDEQQTIRPFTPSPESLTQEEIILLAEAGVDLQQSQRSADNLQADWIQFQQFSPGQSAGQLSQADSTTLAQSESGAVRVLQRQVEQIPESEKSVKPWLQKATDAIQQQFEQARESVQEVGRTLQDWDSKGRETFNQVRQSDEFQTFQDKVKQGAQAVGDWLASRPEAIINHRFARDAFNLFNQGHDRTFENAYQVGDFQISRRGQHTFIVSNDEVDNLLQFQAKKSVLPGQFSFNLQSVNGDAKDFYKAVQQFRKPEAQAVGAPDKEAAYTAKVQHTADTIGQALDALGTDKLDTKDYRIQTAEDGLTIIANDRKRPIYTAERSQLTPKDFKRLQQIGQQIMQETAQNSVQVNLPESEPRPVETDGEHIIDAEIISSYVSLMEESEDLLTQTGFPNREFISLANAAGDTKLKALQTGVPNGAFDQAVAAHESQLQQARVEETAPVLADLLNLEDANQLVSKRGSVITWDRASHTLSVTNNSEVTMKAEWTDAGWRDKGSRLSPTDVERITKLRPEIEVQAQQKQTTQTAQAEL